MMLSANEILVPVVAVGVVVDEVVVANPDMMEKDQGMIKDQRALGVAEQQI